MVQNREGADLDSKKTYTRTRTRTHTHTCLQKQQARGSTRSAAALTRTRHLSELVAEAKIGRQGWLVFFTHVCDDSGLAVVPERFPEQARHCRGVHRIWQLRHEPQHRRKEESMTERAHGRAACICQAHRKPPTPCAPTWCLSSLDASVEMNVESAPGP